jgi:hypothetical protein
VRLRLLVPRRRRRRSLGRLAAAFAAALAPAACGSDAPAPRDALAIGITEPNPAFLAPSPYAEFERWRPAMAELAPAYYRLVVEWDKNVRPDGSFDPEAPQGGCMRTIPPCGGWAGLRAQLAAVADAQRAHPGRFRVMVVPMYSPALHARPPSGCEAPGTTPRSRAPSTAAYRALLRAVQAEADRAGVDIPYWSPWNEPNHPYFLSPQRRRCDPGAPSAATGEYVRLARAMQAELEEGQELVLGELAATTREAARATRMVEFVEALPRDLICGASVFGVHKYGQDDPVAALTAALDAFGCARQHRLWITETGTKDPEAACATDRANLERWLAEPRVDAAFHYTLREDDRFPTGLVTTDLTAALPALDEWRAWGARDPAGPAPASTCADEPDAETAAGTAG